MLVHEKNYMVSKWRQINNCALRCFSLGNHWPDNCLHSMKVIEAGVESSANPV